MGLPVHSHCSPLCVCASRCCLSCVQLLQPYSPHVPMPCRHPDPCPRVFQRLVLQPHRLEPEGRAEREQLLFVRAHQVHHRLAPDGVAMKPHAAVEGEAHPLAAACEFTVRRVYWQVMRPSTVAGDSGAALPENKAHCRPGAKALVVDADHPDVVALTTMVTPAEGLKMFLRAKFVVYFALS